MLANGYLQRRKILNSTIISNIRFPSFKRKLLHYTLLKYSKFHSIHITQRSSTSDDRLYRLYPNRVTMILLLYPALESAMDASVVKLALKVLVDRTIIFFPLSHPPLCFFFLFPIRRHDDDTNFPVGVTVAVI